MEGTGITIPVESFIRQKLNDEDANALLDFWDITAAETDPEYRPSPRDQRLKGLRMDKPMQTDFDWMVRKDDQIIATGVLGYLNENHPGFEQMKDTVFSQIEVHPRYRNQGIGTAILREIATQLRSLDKKKVITGTDNDEGKVVAEHWGGASALAGAENRLYLSDVDWDMVEKWVEEGPIRAPGVTIQEFEELPADIAENYTAVYSEVMNQQPLGDLDVEMKETVESRRDRESRMKEMGMIWTTLVTREPDGSVSGLTETYYNPKNGYRASQDLTGVKQEYRGKGLGKWLKADMLLRLRNRYPDIKFVSTGNADSNAPMLSINERLGFKRFKSTMNFNFDVNELIEKYG